MENKVKEQVVTDRYAIYNSDCMEVIPSLQDESIDLCIYSPPFANLYTYSSSERDMSNVNDIPEFLQQYEYLVKQLSRVTKKGRINAIHVTDICDVSGTLSDFPNEIIKQFGLTHYAGEIPILPNMLRAYNNANKTKFTAEEMWEYLQSKKEDNKISKLNHYIWQRYASSVWDDVREGNVMPYKDSREDDDEKHVTPTQLDVLDRLVDLYSNPDEVILSPFMGVGSDVFSPVSMGRKAIGIELKDSYFKQAKLNLEDAEKRFQEKGGKQLQMDW